MDHALECVAFMLIESDRVLVEKRRLTKSLAPGVIALPGGHVEDGEGLEDAVRRELSEELDVAPLRLAYVCTLLHRAEEFRRLHYFAVERWEGEIKNREADALLWIPLRDSQSLELDVDRAAVAEYLRVYRPQDGRR